MRWNHDILDYSTHFKTASKRKGGKVFVATTRDGEVILHEGWLSKKEAQRKAKASACADGIAQPEKT